MLKLRWLFSSGNSKIIAKGRKWQKWSNQGTVRAFSSLRGLWICHLNAARSGYARKEEPQGGGNGGPFISALFCPSLNQKDMVSVLHPRTVKMLHTLCITIIGIRVNEHIISVFLNETVISKCPSETGQPEALSCLHFWALWHLTQICSLWCRQPKRSRRPRSDSPGKDKAGLPKATCPHRLERLKDPCPFAFCVQPRSLHSRRMAAAGHLPGTRCQPRIDGSFLRSHCERVKNPRRRNKSFCV